MKHSFHKFFISACAIIAAGTMMAACGGSSSGGGTSNAGVGDSATLSTTDFPSSGICATGSKDVTAQTLLDMLANAVQFEFLHKPYTSDADIPFICGLNAVWDPSDATAFGTSTIFSSTTTIQDFFNLTFGAIFLCNTGFGFSPGAAATAGLHEAETYRGELILTDALANTVRIRIRFTVSGTDAGKTLAQLGLTSVDFHVQDANGNDLTTVAEVLALFAANPGSVTVNVVASGVSLDLSALGRVICWE